MTPCTVFVPYANKVVFEKISEQDAFELQASIMQNQKVVAWVIHEVKMKINFEKLIQE